MSFQRDKYSQLLAAKDWGSRELHKETGLDYASLGRYLKRKKDPESGQPSIPVLAKLVRALEVDADFLIGTDYRYQHLSVQRAASHMALDRYLMALERRDEDAAPGDVEKLRQMASTLSSPPMWVEEWRQLHEAQRLLSTTPPESQPFKRARQSRFRNRLGH